MVPTETDQIRDDQIQRERNQKLEVTCSSQNLQSWWVRQIEEKEKEKGGSAREERSVY